MIIDTHCHIYNEYYEDIKFLIKELEKENIIVIVNGVNPSTNLEVLELVRKYNNVYGTLGFHPSEVDIITDEYYLLLEEQLKANKIVGIGEIGLDYYWTKDNKEKQINMFKKQLELAKKYNYPVIIHNRDATEDVIDILSKYKLKGIIHAFSKSIEVANIFIKLGYKLGIGGVLTFKNSKLKEVIKELDLSNIVAETDSPYLTPEPNRGKRNSPLYIKDIIIEISNIKNKDILETTNILLDNTKSIFDLKSQK